jgi:hypothetical protein
MKLAALLLLATGIAFMTWSATEYFQPNHQGVIAGSIGLCALVASIAIFSLVSKRGNDQ